MCASSAGQEGAGPVDFDAPGLDYEQLAVHVMVKFRAAEPLQVGCHRG